MTKVLLACTGVLLLISLTVAGYFACLPDVRNRSSEAFYKGVANFEKAQYDQAIEDYTEAIRIDPEHHPAYHGRGTVYLFKNDWDNAINDFTVAIRLEPKDTTFISRGTAYKKKKLYDEAIKDYSEAIRLYPNDAATFNLRGLAYINKKQLDKALSDYSEAIRLDPKFDLAFLNRGIAYRAKQQYDKAIEDLSEAIRLDPKLESAFLNRGTAYRAKQQYDKAVKDFTEAIRLNPKYFAAYMNFAWLLATCPENSVRNGKKAVEYATQACNLSEWKNPFAISSLAAAHAESGNFKEAVKRQQQAIELGFEEMEDLKVARERLKLYQDGKPYRDK